MFSKVDLIAVIGALGAHAGIAFGLIHVHVPDKPKSSVVEVDVRKAPPPVKVETPPEPPKPEPPPPERKVVMKEKKIITPPTPPPNQEPPPEPPKEPPKPVFGVSMSSTTEGDSSFAVPVGNTTMIDPKNSAKGAPVAPLPAAKSSAPTDFAPKSAVYIKSFPEIDSEACSRAGKYTEEAEQLGIEGTVVLHIEIDRNKKVRKVTVKKGLGHGLDEVAVRAMKYARECQFSKPAVATDNQPADFELDYKFTFELTR